MRCASKTCPVAFAQRTLGLKLDGAGIVAYYPVPEKSRRVWCPVNGKVFDQAAFTAPQCTLVERKTRFCFLAKRDGNGRKCVLDSFSAD